MSGIVGSLNTRGSGLINLGSASDGQLFTGTGAGLPVGFEAAAGGGKLGQLVITTKTDKTAMSASTTFADIAGMTVTITPSATSSKIWISGSIVMCNFAKYIYPKIIRNIDGGSFASPTDWLGDAAGSRIQSTMANMHTTTNADQNNSAAFSLIDSPETTTACIYKFQVRTNNSTATATINGSTTDSDDTNHTRSVSTMIAIEILA